MSPQSVFLAAAADAPRRPGAYSFLGADGRLLYVGVAADLRRRLAQLAHERTVPAHRLAVELVRTVRWEVHPTVESARRREADVVVALRPPFNAAADDGAWTYVRVSGGADTGRLRLDLVTEVDDGGAAGRGRHHGCFPHLGRRMRRQPAIACGEGYAALLRLLWAAGTDPAPMPVQITRSPPPAFEVGLDPRFRRRLHELLSGVSRRLIDDLAAAHGHRDQAVRLGLLRDPPLADRFFDEGPRATRALRLRHGGPPGPVTRQQVEAWLAADVADTLLRRDPAPD